MNGINNGVVDDNGLIDPDLDLSHLFLNYLNSGFQGKFAFLNVLQQLEHSYKDEEVMSATRERLTDSSRWFQDLWDGGAIINELWKRPETFPARKAVEYLWQLKADTRDIGAELVTVLSTESHHFLPGDFKFVIAALAWYAYSRDNFFRAYVEYGNQFMRPDIAEQVEPLLHQAQFEVKHIHHILNEAQELGEMNPEFIQHIEMIVGPVASHLFTMSHEIVQILARFEGEGEFTYALAGIPEEEALIWQYYYVGPQEAGYWRANGITPEEMLDWKDRGLEDYNLASLWNMWGFDPFESAEWLRYGFIPCNAAIWANAGYDAESADYYIGKNYTSPEEIPEILLR